MEATGQNTDQIRKRVSKILGVGEDFLVLGVAFEQIDFN